MDVELLYNDPGQLLIKYQPVIEIILNKFVRSGFFEEADKDDHKQTINEKLLSQKIPKMQAQYNRQYYLSTYFSRVIHNLCLEIKRSMPKEHTLDINAVNPGFSDIRLENLLVIEEEKKRLHTILRLFPKSKARLDFMLRLLSRTTITKSDILNYCPACTDATARVLLAKMGSQHKELTDKEIYAIVTPLINQCEGKSNSTDALRKWMDAKIELLIQLLNGAPKYASYDKSTLKTLLYLYFEKQNDGIFPP